MTAFHSAVLMENPTTGPDFSTTRPPPRIVVPMPTILPRLLRATPHPIGVVRLIALATFVVVVPCEAQLSGVVLDRITNQPIADVRLRLTRSGSSASSTDDGTFVLNTGGSASEELEVTHPFYHPFHLTLGPGSADVGPLRVFLQRVEPAEGAGDEGPDHSVFVEATQTPGVTLWVRADFWPYLAGARHPLDLLTSSGLVRQRSDGADGAPCVRLHGADECATLRVEGGAAGAGALDRFPSEVAGFVVVPPGQAAPGLGFPAQQENGAVVVILGAETR